VPSLALICSTGPGEQEKRALAYGTDPAGLPCCLVAVFIGVLHRVNVCVTGIDARTEDREASWRMAVRQKKFPEKILFSVSISVYFL